MFMFVKTFPQWSFRLENAINHPPAISVISTKLSARARLTIKSSVCKFQMSAYYYLEQELQNAMLFLWTNKMLSVIHHSLYLDATGGVLKWSNCDTMQLKTAHQTRRVCSSIQTGDYKRKVYTAEYSKAHLTSINLFTAWQPRKACRSNNMTATWSTLPSAGGNCSTGIYIYLYF